MIADSNYTALADALDCFWNASLGSAKRGQDITAIAVASALSEGFSAMAARLREHAPPKGEKKGVTAEGKALAEAFAKRLEANAAHAEQMKFTVANLSTLKVDECRDLARILRVAIAAAPDAPGEPEVNALKGAAIKAVYLFADAVKREVSLNAFSPARERAEQAALDAISSLAALAVAAPAQPVVKALTVEDLAQEIRRVDGRHSLGAGALAEALMPFLSALEPSPSLSTIRGEALEEAAKVAEEHLDEAYWSTSDADTAREIAAVIRSLKEGK